MKHLWILFLGLVACDKSVRLTPITAKPSTRSLVKAEDIENGVTCYRFYGNEGIHCFTAAELLQSKMALEFDNEIKKQKGDK